MYSLNRAQLIGNLTRDPESRVTANGMSVVNFGVATSFSKNEGNGIRTEKTEFHNVVAWGKLADICTQFLTKGRKIFVEGRLETRQWDTADGQKRYKTEIVADEVIILDKTNRPFDTSTPTDLTLDEIPF